MPEDAKKTCFIIMPITTPEEFIEEYNGDSDHFLHVLQCLHKPAVKAAGFAPIESIAQGADLIQAEIISNLETADLVLCDISCLNPNVFFEMGVRTSLNKPMCFVMDEHTGKIPFDTGIINHKEYKSTLNAWELEDQINHISEHLKASFERSDGQNTLWRRLGIKSEAQAYQMKEGTDPILRELLFQMQAIQEKVDSVGRSTTTEYVNWPITSKDEATSAIREEINSILSNVDIGHRIEVKRILSRRDGIYSVYLNNAIPEHVKNVIIKEINQKYSIAIDIKSSVGLGGPQKLDNVLSSGSPNERS